MGEKNYGVNKEYAHSNAIKLIPEDFFWNCADQLAPFGSDAGDAALAEFRRWRKANPNMPTGLRLIWTIEGIGEMSITDYNDSILSKEKIKNQIEDKEFDDYQYIYTLDISVIATGFAELVDEGKVDERNKGSIKIAIERQKIWAELNIDWEYSKQYISNLKVLERVLNEA